jgi:hypothetical protein
LPIFAGALGLLFCADVASAGEPGVPLLQANLIYELVADRARMIQVSLVIVALGCALLWWRR